MNDELKLLNNPQLGSFGEFLVAHFYQINGSSVELVHKNNVDILINGVSYDVKTTKGYLGKDVDYSHIPKYKGSRKDGVDYIYTIPLNQGVLITKDGVLIYQFKEESLELYNKWKSSKSVRKFKSAKKDDNFIKSVAIRLSDIAKVHGKTIRILHRNGIQNQIKFGKYGPKNLIPLDRTKQDITACVWTEGNTIHKIIAFNHSDIDNLPLYKHSIGFTQNFLTLSLHKFSKECSFDSIEDFEQRFFS